MRHQSLLFVLLVVPFFTIVLALASNNAGSVNSNVGQQAVPAAGNGRGNGAGNGAANGGIGFLPTHTVSTHKGAIETIDQNILVSDKIECSRCGGNTAGTHAPTRLIGCKWGRCYYRCYRRCHDFNGTYWDEAIRFTLPGN